MNDKVKIAFVSGHLDVTHHEFAQHYAPKIAAHLGAGGGFVVAESRGVDCMALDLLCSLNARNVTVFHLFESPRHNPGNWPTVGGFSLASECDAAMTRASDLDITWVRPGREKSHTANNIRRRIELHGDEQRNVNQSEDEVK